MVSLNKPGGSQINFAYWPDGQLAGKHAADDSLAHTGLDIQPVSYKTESLLAETYLWDGLALLRHNDRIYITEPHPSGGVPIASYSISNPSVVTYYLSDLLGTTLASIEGGVTQFTKLTAFGQPLKFTTMDPISPNFSTSAPITPIPPTESIPTIKSK